MFLPIGTVLQGKYRIDGHIASGGFGNTYVVTHLDLDAKVAVKEFFMKGVNHRDGSWYNNARHCRVSFRDWGGRSYRYSALGLRLVL